MKRFAAVKIGKSYEDRREKAQKDLEFKRTHLYASYMEVEHHIWRYSQNKAPCLVDERHNMNRCASRTLNIMFGTGLGKVG